jgi:hypothetical protein
MNHKQQQGDLFDLDQMQASALEPVETKLSDIEESQKEQGVSSEIKETAHTSSEEKIEGPVKAKQIKSSPSPLLKDYQDFLTKLDALEDKELQIRALLDFMKSSIDAKTAPHLSLFWKARRLSLPLFKENIPVAARTSLWKEYIELMKEAQHLKVSLEEQASFAVEQIELAIHSLEEGLDSIEQFLSGSTSLALPKFELASVSESLNVYQKTQQELVFLNAQATRIHSLRKEVIKTGMRLSIKNKFFHRLSLAGDRVFPRRRELINNISELFFTHVAEFEKDYFEEKPKEAPTFALREEIKAFQELAKLLTLNTRVFNKTRQLLSKCWDAIKEKDKERKKEFFEKKELFIKHRAEGIEKLKIFSEYCTSESAKQEEIDRMAKEFISWMRGVELSREDVTALRDELKRAQAPFYSKIEKVKATQQKLKQEKKEQKVQRKQAFQNAVELLQDKCRTLGIDELEEKKTELSSELTQLDYNDFDNLGYHVIFRDIEEILLEKREAQCFEKSKTPEYVIALHDCLERRENEKRHIKDVLEGLRKLQGGSGFDFEQSMKINEIVKGEKARFDRFSQAMAILEEKVEENEG